MTNTEMAVLRILQYIRIQTDLNQRVSVDQIDDSVFGGFADTEMLKNTLVNLETQQIIGRDTKLLGYQMLHEGFEYMRNHEYMPTMADIRTLTEKDVVLFWPYDTAPRELQDLSPHGGDEDWIVICSPKMEDDSLVFRECGYMSSDERMGDDGEEIWTSRWEPRNGDNSIGSCSTSRHEYEGLIIFIGAHA